MDAKKEFNPFQLASAVEDMLAASGASKKQKKEVLDLLASRIGCRLVAVGVPLERRQAAVATASSGSRVKAPKGSSTNPGKTKFNQDPQVKDSKAVLDAVLKEIRDLKKEGKEVPPNLLKRKAEALDLLAAAKAAAGRTSFASPLEKKEQGAEPQTPAPAAGRISFREALANQKA